MNILAFAEVRDGKLKKSSLETLSEARRIAASTGGTASAILAGEGVRAQAATGEPKSCPITAATDG